MEKKLEKKPEIIPGKIKMQKIITSAIVPVICLIFISCGLKAPPVPPASYPPVAVTDLSAKVSSDFLTLTWTIPAPANATSGKAENFFVYRSKTSLSQPDCPKCPIVFDQVARLPVNGKSQLTYTETLVKGNKYIYKVVPYSNAGVQGKNSNLAELVY